MRNQSCLGFYLLQHFLEINRWDCVTRQNLVSEGRLYWEVPDGQFCMTIQTTKLNISKVCKTML